VAGQPNQEKQNMKSEKYGITGIAIGLIALVLGILGKHLICFESGIFLFGCGLIAAAIGAKK